MSLNNFIPYSKNVENFINKYILIFTLIVLYQGTMGAQAFKAPRVIKELANSGLFNLCGLFSIAFTASKDIEIALVSTIIYMLIIFFLNKYENSDVEPVSPP